MTRDILTRDPPALGTWLMSGNPNLAEAMACRAFDFLVIDTEHVAVSLETVLHMARAIEARGKTVIVRLADHDPARIRWMLDAGLGTLMVPMVDTPDQARTVSEIMHYPPHGRRGFAAMLRANGYNSDPDYFAQASDRVTFIAQLETPSALEAADQIAAIDGVSALFFGPGDISATTGHLGQGAGEDTLNLIDKALVRCRDAKIPAGTVMPRPDLVRRMLDKGASFAAIASDLGFATGAATAALADIRREY